MRRLIEPSHLHLRCLQKHIIIACAVKELNAIFIWTATEEKDLLHMRTTKSQMLMYGSDKSFYYINYK